MNERGNKSAWRVLLNGVYSPPISFFFNQTNEEKRFGISLLLPFLLCKTFGGIIKPSFQSKRCIEMYRFFFLFNLILWRNNKRYLTYKTYRSKRDCKSYPLRTVIINWLITKQFLEILYREQKVLDVIRRAIWNFFFRYGFFFQSFSTN